MRIAIVHDWLTGMRGGEKCLEAACRLFPDAELHTLLHKKESVSETIERMTIRTSFLQRVPGITRHYRWALPIMPWAVRGLRPRGDIDLVLSFSSCVAKSAAVPAGVPHVCYCHTPMRYAWHLKEDYFPHAGRFSPIRVVRERALARLRHWDRATSEGVTDFVANSRTVAQRIADCYGRSSMIISPPVDVDFFTPDRRVKRQDFYLVVSALVPYKRVDLAVAACERLGRPLVVIGTGPLATRLRRPFRRHVRFLGWQPPEVVRDHFRRCRALLFPGLEDFGITPLEAGACGAPVLAFGRGGAAETLIEGTTAQPGTAVFFHEQSVDAVCRAITRFEQEPSAISSGLARLRAERYAMPRFERELIGVLEGTLARRVARPPAERGVTRERRAA